MYYTLFGPIYQERKGPALRGIPGDGPVVGFEDNLATFRDTFRVEFGDEGFTGATFTGEGFAEDYLVESCEFFHKRIIPYSMILTNSKREPHFADPRLF